MNTTEKLIEVKFNKEVWKKNKIKVLETVLLTITMIATILLLLSIVAMVETWSISGEPFIISIICLAWLVPFSLYAYYVSE